jgi:hypothetical protein
LVFHADGQCGVTEDGKKVKLPGSGRLRARIAFPISSSELITFHQTGVCRVSLRDRSQKQLTTDKWARAIAVARCPTSSSKVVVLHDDGIYQVDVVNGSYNPLTDGFTWGWSRTKAVIHDPNTPAFLYVFHSGGLFKLSLMDGKHKRLGKHTWHGARAAAYHRNEAVVFHQNGLYRVSLVDGECEGWTVSRVSTKKGECEELISARYMPQVRSVIRLDADCILALHSEGVHEFNLETGKFKRMSTKDRFDNLICVTDLGPEVMVSSAACSSWDTPKERSHTYARAFLDLPLGPGLSSTHLSPDISSVSTSPSIVTIAACNSMF